MRPYLTIALLVVASIGAQTAAADSRRQETAPGLLGQVPGRTAAIIGTAQIALQSPANLLACMVVTTCAVPVTPAISLPGPKYAGVSEYAATFGTGYTGRTPQLIRGP